MSGEEHHDAGRPDGDDGPDDREASGVPPHPLDRVWFHPSELSAQLGNEVPATAPGPPRRDWGLATLTAAAAVLATLAVVAATGGFSGDASDRASVSIATAVLGLGSGDAVTDLVAESRASIVSVRAAGADPAVAPTTGSGVALGRTEVLTAASILTNAVSVTVATDGRVLTATVLGIDTSTDLALLDVPDGGLGAAPLGSSDDLDVGQMVVGVGVVGGDHRWAGQGLVSSIGRLVTTTSGIVMAGLVETDLEPGQSVAGGALLDGNGEVVGILTAAAPGHAVPIDWARDLAEQLATSGHARHGYLGVDAVDAGEVGGGGARVSVVAGESPAAAAGLRQGDVITALGGERITDFADLVTAVAQLRPGDPVDVMVTRGSERVRLKATLGERTLPTPVATLTSAP
jgi:putative serine protease PepD